MRQVLVLLAVIALTLIIVACAAPPTPTPTPVPSPTPRPSPTAVPTKVPPTPTATPVPPLSMDALKNAEYVIEGPAAGKAKLTNGTFKEPIPKSPASVTVQMSEVSAIGDLNGDGVQDAAVILTVNTGGSGVFYYLYGVLNEKGTPKPLAPAVLGDRIKLKSLAIQGTEIVIEFLTQGPRDSMANPTLAVTRKYQVQANQLVSTTPPTPTAAAPTKAAVATPRRAVTATPTKPPLPKGSIAFHWNDQGIDRISVLNVETKQITPFVVAGPVMDIQAHTNAHIGEWSPDGSKFAYIFAGTLGASNILKVRSGESVVDLYASDASGGLSSPTWSPDGKRLAFVRLGGDRQAWSIIIINADGTKCTPDKFECLVKQVAGEQYRGGLAWSKQGVLAVGFNTTGKNDVYTMYADGTLAKNVSNHEADDGSPAWSPDGKQIAFTSTRDGKPQIYLVNADGTGLRRISDNTAADFSPTFSPDGRWIAFASTRGGATNIYMMDVTGRNVTQLTQTGGDHPIWSR